MYCPQCGLERVSEQTNFCSRCGFLLTGVTRLIQNGGEISGNATTSRLQSTSARAHGLKQGLFIFLLTFLVVPLVAIISIALKVGPALAAISTIILFFGGILRMVYALLFEPAQDASLTSPAKIPAQTTFGAERADRSALPPQQTVPVSNYAAPGPGRWLDSNDLLPVSVTENTTQLLERDEGRQ